MVRKMIKNKRAFSLIELLIVISIMAILSYFGINYILSAMEKSKIEKDLKKMYGLLQEARIKAFTEKRSFTFELDITSKKACIKESSTVVKCVDLEDDNYSLNNTITIDKRGTFTGGTIEYNGSISNLAYNCIVVSDIRVKLGVNDGSGCEPK